MKDYILLMHAGAPSAGPDAWGSYIGKLRAGGHFEGGSSIGAGICVSKAAGHTAAISNHLAGYLRIQADDLEHATRLLAGNPVFEAGGTVEIRELPRD